MGPKVLPVRALALLFAIGLLDCAATVTLHAQDRMVETNPLMAPFLARGEGMFVVVKLATLALAGFLLVREGRRDPKTVQRACFLGSGVYVALLITTVCRS